MREKKVDRIRGDKLGADASDVAKRTESSGALAA